MKPVFESNHESHSLFLIQHVPSKDALLNYTYMRICTSEKPSTVDPQSPFMISPKCPHIGIGLWFRSHFPPPGVRIRLGSLPLLWCVKARGKGISRHREIPYQASLCSQGIISSASYLAEKPCTYRPSSLAQIVMAPSVPPSDPGE